MIGSDLSIFELLEQHDERIGLLALEAERYLDSDPSIAAIKFRVFGELLVAEVGRIKNRHRRGGEAADRYIERLASSRYISDKAAKHFHNIRKIGNAAAHGEEVIYGDSLEASKSARVVTTWFLSRYSKEIFQSYSPQKPNPRPVGEKISTLAHVPSHRKKMLSRAEVLAASIRRKAGRKSV